MKGRAFGFLIFLAVLVGIDIYAFQGVRHLTKDFSKVWQTVVFVGYWSLTVFILFSTIALFMGWFSRTDKTGRTLFFVAFAFNYFPKLILFLFVAFDDIVRLIKWIISMVKDSESDTKGEAITRSDFILKLGVAATTIPAVATGVGILSGAYDYRVKKRTVVIPNLPRAFDGIKVAQLSDIHSGSFYNKTAVKGGIELLNAQKPDVVFFTGDLVNDRAEEVEEYLPVLDKIKADMGVYSVLGNHDYGDYVQWSTPLEKNKNLQDLKDAHAQMGWNLLLDEHTSLKVDGEELGILGVENWGNGFAQYGSLEKTIEGANYDAKILLSHDPSHWDAQIRSMAPDIDLTLSGHTHGMQFGVELGDFRWSPSKYRYKQWADLYTQNNQHIYVNRGFGFLGFPGRIGILPEITILELKRTA